MRTLLFLLALSVLAFPYIVGAPEAHCSTCHTPAKPVKFVVKGLPKYYEPGKSYNVTVSIVGCKGKCCGGFYFSIPGGKVIITNTTIMQIKRPFFGTPYVTHTKEGTHRTSWSFVWVAPKEKVPLTFTVSVLKANCNEKPTGDDFSMKEIKVYPKGYVPKSGSSGLPYLVLGLTSIALAIFVLIISVT